MSKTKTRKPKLVHFTHHACLVHRDAIGLDEQFRQPGTPRAEYTSWCADYSRRYNDAPRPEWEACHFARDATHPLLTSDRSEVTCPHCIAKLKSESLETLQLRATECHPRDRDWYMRRVASWVDDRELTARAWIVCCRRYGAPCPVASREALRRLRDDRARAFRESTVSIFGAALVGMLQRADGLAKALEKMDPADRKLMHGTVERARKADALIAKAAKINESIDATVKQAAKRIAASAVISLPAMGR